jgi:hypothetical protein
MNLQSAMIHAEGAAISREENDEDKPELEGFKENALFLVPAVMFTVLSSFPCPSGRSFT